FGLLSKYTMIVFPVCALAYGLFSGWHRHRLASAKPWAGVLLGLAMFFPVILWNAQHGWNSVRHIAYLGGVNQSVTLHWKYLGEYIASQAALLSPLAFFLILVAWWRATLGKVEEPVWVHLYCLWTSLPMFAGFALLSLHTRVYGNWPGAGYLTASVLGASLFSRKRKVVFSAKPASRSRLWPWTLATSYAVTALVLAQVAWPVLPIPVALDRTVTELSGWKELGAKVEQVLQQMPRQDRTFLFGLRYQVASELAFYVPGNPETVSINRWRRPNVYDYWWHDQELMGRDAVGVTLSADSHATQLSEVFERVDPPIPFPVFLRRPFGGEEDTVYVKTFYIYRAYGFRGGLRWVPPEGFDVRKSTKVAQTGSME
ncbi:glycosyltransferase family 39 protein, partial [Thermodesulfobacteriota bacterium]